MPSIVLLIWFTLCTEQDLRCRRINDSLTLGAAALAFFYLLGTGSTWIGAPATQGGWALLSVMLLTAPGYRSGRLDATEVKLLGALALATDCSHVLGTALGTCLALAAWTLVGPWVWRRISPLWRRKLAILEPQPQADEPVVPFMLAGFILTLLWLS